MISKEFNERRQRRSFRTITDTVARLARRVRRLEVEEPSWLDVWDKISSASSTLEPEDHFREHPLTKVDTEWLVDTALFTDISDAISQQYSQVELAGISGTQRAFLYKAKSPAATNIVVCAGFSSTGGVGGSFEGGLRIDDGTDDNYMEYGIRVDALSSDTRWLPIHRERNGGGGATETTSGDNILTPYPLVLRLNLTGTLYSSWAGTPLIRPIGPMALNMWKDNVAIGSALSWTPTRTGLYLRGSASAATWMTMLVDWAEF